MTETALQQIKGLCRSQEDHGIAARKAGDIQAARRYFTRAEAYAMAAWIIARDMGEEATMREMDNAQTVNFRRAVNEQAIAA